MKAIGLLIIGKISVQCVCVCCSSDIDNNIMTFFNMLQQINVISFSLDILSDRSFTYFFPTTTCDYELINNNNNNNIIIIIIIISFISCEM